MVLWRGRLWISDSKNHRLRVVAMTGSYFRGDAEAVLARGDIGLAESWLDGLWDSPDPAALLSLLAANRPTLAKAVYGSVCSLLGARLRHAFNANTRAGSRRNILAHYDLGNDFYRLWLDPGMSYSSGIHSDASTSLDDAQAAKHARIVDLLELGPADDVLEIGCGWGGLAAEILPHARSLTAITISAQQFEATRARLAATEHAARADVVFQDYRDTTGSFDRIVSIEMIEAVGEDNWPAYFRTLDERLKPGGSAVIQAITIRDDLYEGYRRSPDFIQRYIFPGGMLPTVAAMRCHAQSNGLQFEEVLSFGSDYAVTLRAWQERFHDKWPLIARLGFDERFRRMWDYYLTYCAVGFERGLIDVGLFRLRKPSA